MCQQIWTSDSHVIDSIGEARTFWPIIVLEAGYDHPAKLDGSDDEHCICSIDVEKTVEANGQRVRRDRCYDWEIY